MNKNRAIGLGFALVALCGCADNVAVGISDAGFGEAVRRNAAAQVINPAAPQDRGPVVANGERAARQQQRYVTDTVEKPANVSTQATQGGGGGGNGGGGAGAGAAATP